MSATAGLLRCCCQAGPSTCQQVLNYCPEYLRVDLPAFTVRTRMLSLPEANPQNISYTIVGPAGCYYGPSQQPEYGHVPFNRVVYDYEATLSASALLFRRMPTNSQSSCQGQCNTCQRYCFIRGTMQTGELQYNYRMTRGHLFFDANQGGPMQMVDTVDTAVGNIPVANMSPSEQAAITGRLTTVSLPGGACQHTLEFGASSYRPLSNGGAQNDGYWCPCCSPNTTPGNCLTYRTEGVNIGLAISQRWVSPGPPSVSCPGTTQPIEAYAAPWSGGSFGLGPYSVNLLDPSLSSWLLNSCNGTGTNRYSSPAVTCRLGGWNDYLHCEVHECSAQGPAVVAAA